MWDLESINNLKPVMLGFETSFNECNDEEQVLYEKQILYEKNHQRTYN